MNKEQLLKQLRTNHELIGRNNEHAYDHLLMLKSDYAHLVDEEVELFMELNTSLAMKYFRADYAGALNNSLALISRYGQTTYRYLLAQHLRLAGHVYAEQAEYELAEEYLFKALENVHVGDPDYESIRALILYTLAMMHEFRCDGPEKPIAYLTEAIALLSDEMHGARRATCMMGLGNIYNEAEQIEQALKHYLDAAEMYEQRYLLADMAAAYSNIGNCYIKLVEFDRAEKYLNKSLELRLKAGSPSAISISYYNLGVLYKERGELEKANELFLQTKQQAERSGNRQFLEMIEAELADLHKKNNQQFSAG